MCRLDRFCFLHRIMIMNVFGLSRGLKLNFFLKLLSNLQRTRIVMVLGSYRGRGWPGSLTDLSSDILRQALRQLPRAARARTEPTPPRQVALARSWGSWGCCLSALRGLYFAFLVSLGVCFEWVVGNLPASFCPLLPPPSIELRFRGF
jgi:hypothetical protein